MFTPQWQWFDPDSDSTKLDFSTTVSHGRERFFLDELENLLRRGLLLLESARSEMHVVQTGFEQPSHKFGLTKMAGGHQVAHLMKSEPPPAPPQQQVSGTTVKVLLDTFDPSDLTHDLTKRVDCAPQATQEETKEFGVISHGEQLTLPALSEQHQNDDADTHYTGSSMLGNAKSAYSANSRFGVSTARFAGIYAGSRAPEAIKKETKDIDIISNDDQVALSALSEQGKSDDVEISRKVCSMLGNSKSNYSAKSKSGVSTTSFAGAYSGTASFADAYDGSDLVRTGSKHGKLALAIEAFLDDPESSHLAGYFNMLVSSFIQFSVVLSLWQTVESPPLDMDTFGQVQIALDTFFLAEFGVRLCVCSNLSMFGQNIHNIIDFIAAVLPLSLRAALFLGLIESADDDVVEYIVFCVAPPLREMKILRRVQQFHLFARVLLDIREAVQTLLMLLMMMVLIFSSLLYISEPRENIHSMPRAVWMTIVTMTTVGYGDVTPETTPGYIIASILALCSVLYMAMPIGIIGNAFTQTWNDRDFILLMIKTRGAMLKSGYAPKDLPAIFQNYSKGTGELTLDDFLTMVRDMNLGLKRDRALKVFELIDRDGGGSIDEQEFVRSVFPSAFHDLYQSKRNSQHSDGSDNLTLEEIAFEGFKSVGRQISPGADALHCMVMQLPPVRERRDTNSSPRERPPSK